MEDDDSTVLPQTCDQGHSAIHHILQTSKDFLQLAKNQSKVCSGTFDQSCFLIFRAPWIVEHTVKVVLKPTATNHTVKLDWVIILISLISTSMISFWSQYYFAGTFPPIDGATCNKIPSMIPKQSLLHKSISTKLLKFSDVIASKCKNLLEICPICGFLQKKVFYAAPSHGRFCKKEKVQESRHTLLPRLEHSTPLVYLPV